MGQDIAAGEIALGTFTPVQLFAGEAKIITGDYELAVAVVKYGVYALDATGKVIVWDPAGTAPIKLEIAARRAAACSCARSTSMRRS